MEIITVICLLLLLNGAGCFALAAFGGKPIRPGVNVLALGLLAWISVDLLRALARLLA